MVLSVAVSFPAGVLPPAARDVVPCGRQVAHPRDLVNLRSGHRGIVLVVRDVSRGELLKRAGVAKTIATSAPLTDPRDGVLTVAKALFSPAPESPSGSNPFSLLIVVGHELCSMAEEEFLRSPT